MKRYFLLTMLALLLTGCSAVENNREFPDNISFSPIVCQYTTTPAEGTVIDYTSSNIIVYDNNTVEIFCGDFHDTIDADTDISIDYIYGETFEITEEQKQSVISAIRENNIAYIFDCGDESSSDGSYSYILLFNSESEKVHSCGGLNPYTDEYETVRSAIFSVLPENAFRSVSQKADEELIAYLLENYPDNYSWLENR